MTKCHSVLQSATPVLLCTTKYYPVLLRSTKYCYVLHSATPYYKLLYKVLLHTTKSTTTYYKVLLHVTLVPSFKKHRNNYNVLLRTRRLGLEAPGFSVSSGPASSSLCKLVQSPLLLGMAQVLSHKSDIKKRWWCSSLKARPWHVESILNLKFFKVPFLYPVNQADWCYASGIAPLPTLRNCFSLMTHTSNIL